MENEKISVNQFTLLVFMYTLGSSILVIPSQLAAFAKNNAWISSIIGLIVGCLFIFLFVRISAVYPDKTFVEINTIVFGRRLGNFLSILFLLPVFIMGTGNLREIGNFFTTQVMVETPIHAIHFLTLITAIYVIRKGLEVMARTCEIFFPWTAVFLIILVIFLIPEMKIENLTPNFSNGVGPILAGTYQNLSNPFSQLVVFLMILPNVNNVSKARKGFFVGAISGGLGITIIIIMCIAILGSDITTRSIYPTYILGKKISIGSFLERIEVLVAISWILSLFFKLVVNIYVILLGLAQILKMNDFKPLVFPFGFLFMVYSLVNFPNIVYLKEYTVQTWPAFSFTFLILLPFIVLIFSLINQKIYRDKQQSL